MEFILNIIRSHGKILNKALICIQKDVWKMRGCEVNVEAECHGLNCVPPKRYVEVLTSSTCVYDFIWKRGHCRYNDVKMKSSGWALIQCDSCPYEKREIWTQTRGGTPSEDTGAHRGDSHVKTEVENGILLPEPQSTFEATKRLDLGRKERPPDLSEGADT